jgi:hypothetical protein
MSEKDKRCPPNCELCARDEQADFDDSGYEQTYPEDDTDKDPEDYIDEDGEQELREFLTS